MFDKLVDLIVSSIKLFFFAFTLHQYERGVLLRFGKYVKEVGPGFHFKWPFDIDEIMFNGTMAKMLLLGPQNLTTKDGTAVAVSYLVTYEIEDITKSIMLVNSSKSAIEYASYGVVNDFVARHTWAELRNIHAVDEAKDIDLDNELAKKMRRRAKKYGINVLDVGICDLTPSRAIRLITSSPQGGAEDHI
jgi:regulator of protease activity HflC (stomatin/prohibitin superfamily)